VVTSLAGRCRRQALDDGSAFKSSKLQSLFAVAKLAKMGDRERDRDGGGLAVVLLAGFAREDRRCPIAMARMFYQSLLTVPDVFVELDPEPSRE